MEYLMTYGWALLIIIVVMAIFIALIMMLQAPEMCNFDPGVGFLCNNPMPVIDPAGNINVRLHNGNAQKVEILEIACSESDDVTAANFIIPTDTDLDTNNHIPSGQSDDMKVGCVSTADYSSGDTFDGYLIVKYTFNDDIVTERYATAQLSTTLQ